MEIFENRNNFAGNSFQFVVMSTGVAAIPAEMPFIIWLQFNRVKRILRKVKGVVFSLPPSTLCVATFPSRGRLWADRVVRPYNGSPGAFARRKRIATGALRPRNDRREGGKAADAAGRTGVRGVE